MSRVLHHWQLDPFSRQVRIALSEKGIRARLKEERVWDGRQDFLALNPAGTTPVMVEQEGPERRVIVGARAIVEYLEEAGEGASLLPGLAPQRAEIRRIADWFDRKFDAEVNGTILFEKVDKRLTGQGAPDAGIIREGRTALKAHLEYISTLIDARHYLGCGQFTLADLAAAAHLSCLDYFSEVDWQSAPVVADWYARVKSRPSFRTLLEDRLPGLPPPDNYALLDF